MLKMSVILFLLFMYSINNGVIGLTTHKLKAFLCFVDALMMFNGLPDKSLSIELNRDITRALSMFVEDNVFVEENDAGKTFGHS